MKSVNEIIKHKTGMKFSSCSCERCKKQCRAAPCLGTPEDIINLIKAGYAERIAPTDWCAGVALGITNEVIQMYQAKITPTGCTFFKDGLCELHNLGLKPIEGRLSHHSVHPTNFVAKKSISWNVAKQWKNPKNAALVISIGLALLEERNTHESV